MGKRKESLRIWRNLPGAAEWVMEPLTPGWRSQEEDRSGQSVERNSEFGWGSVQFEVLKKYLCKYQYIRQKYSTK